jgi:hypothetical protein
MANVRKLGEGRGRGLQNRSRRTLYPSFVEPLVGCRKPRGATHSSFFL